MARLLATLLLGLVLVSAATAQGLTVAGDQPTLGLLGPKRAAGALLPGDTYTLALDVAGLNTDAEGRFRYAVMLRLEDSAGKVLYLDTQDVGPLGNALAGGKIRHSVQIATALDQPPGDYTLKITAVDRGTKAGAAAPEASLQKKFSVQKPELGLVRPQITADEGGKVPAPPLGIRGQTLHYSVVVVGFEADKSGQGNLQVELSAQDERGQTLAAKPISAEFRDIPKETKYLPLRLDLPLTRAGQFKVQLKATDLVTKKSTMLTLPLKVLDPVE